MENLFGLKHIIGLIWVLIFVVISFFIMAKFKNKRRVMKVSSLILLMLEFIKFYYIYKTDGSISKIYIPLQFCSLFLYTFPIISFTDGKIAEFLKPVSYAGGIVAMLLALILPTNILGDPNMSWIDPNNFLYTLSFIYHGFVLALSTYMFQSGFYIKKEKDIFKTVAAISIFASIAIIFNIILDTDFMLMNRGDGNPFQGILTNYGFCAYFSLHVILMFVFLTPFFVNKKQD